ncbi:MAG: S4 domain-containing protein [Pseudomonadota bacterium]
MRLSKFLSLSVAMSLNQAKFFIRKGRLSVDGAVITDPFFEVGDDARVVFDGESIEIANYRYVVLHKPPAYACATKGGECASVLELLDDGSDERYYYFANTLGTSHSGLVLLSDDARWASRIKKRLLTKPHVYRFQSRRPITEDQIRRLEAAWPVPSGKLAGPAVDIQTTDDATLLLSTRNIGAKAMQELFAATELSIEALHLQQVGRLELGALAEGSYLVRAEEEIKI